MLCTIIVNRHGPKHIPLVRQKRVRIDDHGQFLIPALKFNLLDDGKEPLLADPDHNGRLSTREELGRKSHAFKDKVKPAVERIPVAGLVRDTDIPIPCDLGSFVGYIAGLAGVCRDSLDDQLSVPAGEMSIGCVVDGEDDGSTGLIVNHICWRREGPVSRELLRLLSHSFCL